MALYGAFSSSILGMMSQSYALGTISNNIANMNTGGYRATETRFATVYSDTMFEQSDLGGVRPKDTRLMDLQGNMMASARNLDIAVNGKGFLMVSPTLDVSDVYYTRDGSLQTQAGEVVPMVDENGNPVLDASGAPMTTREGYLADKNGYFLLGWPAEADGTFNTTGAPQPMRVDQYAFVDQGRATSAATLVMNIPSGAGVGESFDYYLNLYDDAGQQQVAVVSFTKTARPNVWDVDVRTEDPGDAITLGPGRDFNLDTGTEMVFTQNAVPGDGTGTITVRDIATQTPVDLSALSVGDSISIAGTGSNNSIFTITAINGGTLTVAENVTAEIDNDGATMAAGAVLFSHESGTQTVIDVTAGTIEIRDGASNPLAQAFAGLAAGDSITLTGTANNDGTYTIASVSADGSTITVDAATPLPGISGTDADGVHLSAPAALAQRLQFDANGRVISPENLSIDITWAPNGAVSSTALDISDMTQFSDDQLVTSFWQNGYGPAYLKGINFDQDGRVLGLFDGTTDRPLYRIAMATFTNASGLEEHNGNVYSVTQESGEAHIFAPGDDAYAMLSPNTRELSNVDVADEFTRMIMTQHAYTASSKVFQTVDEMIEVARDLKR